LRALGFRQVRVRHHGEIVRIEIAKDEMARALTMPMLAELNRIFKSLGFVYVTLDVEGFRSGSMNASASRAAQPLIKLQPITGAGAAGDAPNQAKVLVRKSAK